MQVEALKLLLSETAAEYGVIFCHHNADPDALFSSYVFSRLLRKLKPKLRCDVVAVQGPSNVSKLLMNKVHVELTDKPKLEEADFVALVDTSTTEQLDEWGLEVKNSRKPLIIVDHHTPHPDTGKLATLSLIDSEAKSTCEIVYELCREAGFKVGRKHALALFLGIIFETKGLRYASAKTFHVVAELTGRGIDVEKAFRMMSMPMSRSERFARLKAAGRLKTHKVGKWILASSHVSSYEASTARAFLGLGADVAVIVGGKGGKVRVSLRSTSEFFKETGIHLGRDVAIDLGKRFSGMGGGHPTSAGVNGYGNVAQVISEAVKVLRSKIES